MSGDIASFLRTCEAFSSLSVDSAQRLSAFMKTVAYKAGEYVVRRGEAGDRFFVVRSGSVSVPIFDANGRRQFIAHLTEGQVFGEMALLTGEPRNADVVAATDTECLVIDRDTADELFSEHPEVASFMTTILGERLLQSGGIREVGKYRLTGELGRGGMAIVYEGIHPQLDRAVAIKMLSHSLVYRRHFAERFRNEGRAIAGLRHPNIVEVFDIEEAYATVFIVMEKLSGMDVERILDERGRMEPGEVRRVIRDTASALQYAHDAGIVHRDVKPSNIVIEPNDRVKLTDFGIAAISGVEENLSQDKGMYLGTPAYSSPEHAMGKIVDGRSDIYALGIVAYEMLLGHPPFDSDDSTELLLKHVHDPLEPPRTYDPSIPKDLEDFIMKACAKRPEERWQSCREIVEFFDRLDHRLTAPRSVRVKTVTFVYTPEVEADVERLTSVIRTMAEPVEGLVVKAD